MNRREQIEQAADSMEKTLAVTALAGGALLEAEGRTPVEQAACGFDALHDHVANSLLAAPDQHVGTLMIGLLAGAAMFEMDINPVSDPAAPPPTPDGAFDMFERWGRAEGRSFADLKRLYKLGADMGAESYVLVEALIATMRAGAAEDDSDG